MQERIKLIDVLRQLATGHESATETAREVWAGVRSVTRSEFYQAYQAGLTASVIFRVNTDELGAAEYVEWPIEESGERSAESGEASGGAKNRYKILRTYRVDAQYTELTAEKMR